MGNWKQAIWLPRIKEEILRRCQKSNDWVKKIDVINAVANNPKYSAELSKISRKAKEASIDLVGNMADWLDADLTQYEKSKLSQGWIDFIADFNSFIERKRIKSNAEKQNGKNPYAYRLRDTNSSLRLRHWIFVGKDEKDGFGKRLAVEIYAADMRNRFWGIKEKARNIDRLHKGDKIVFYLGDSGGKRFYGTATINSDYLNRKNANKRGHEFSGVELVNIDVWDEKKPLEETAGKLKITASKSDYRQCLRGSIHEIEKEDYAIIAGPENEANSREQLEMDEESHEDDPDLTESPRFTIAKIKIRSALFRKKVRENYAFSCAVCGSCRFTKDGLPEVEAAHIYPIARHGRNNLRNGISLCKLHHWAFENGIFGIRNDYSIIVEKRIEKDKAYHEINRFENAKISLPAHENYRPHKKFLREHRRIHDLGIGSTRRAFK